MSLGKRPGGRAFRASMLAGKGRGKMGNEDGTAREKVVVEYNVNL